MEEGFKPYIGKNGEIYFKLAIDGKEIISFIPSIYCNTYEDIVKWLNETYSRSWQKKYKEKIMKQINGLWKKEF